MEVAEILYEEVKMTLPVISDFLKPGMAGEIMMLVCFQNKKPAFLQNITIENKVRELRDFLQSIGRAGKNIVKLPVHTPAEAEDIVAINADQITDIKLVGSLPDESHTSRKFIDIRHIDTSQGNAFKAMAACSAKQVKHGNY